MEWNTNSLGQFKHVTGELFSTIVQNHTESHALVITLSGDLGAGKTTMTQYIAELVGVNEIVQSPTFVIKKQYRIDYKNFNELIHVDAYRLEDEKKNEIFQFESDIQNPENILVIEWSEFISEILPETVHMVSIESLSEEERKITYNKKTA